MVETGTRVCWASSRYARDEARKLRGASTSSSTATERPQKDVVVHPAELMYPAYGKEKPSSAFKKHKERDVFKRDLYTPREYTPQSSSRLTDLSPSVDKHEPKKEAQFDPTPSAEPMNDADAFLEVITALQVACSTLSLDQQKDRRERQRESEEVVELREKFARLQHEVDMMKTRLSVVEDMIIKRRA